MQKNINKLSVIILLSLVCFGVGADSKFSLVETGEAFKQIAEEALPAVVFIDVESTIEVDTRSYEHPFFEQFFGRGWQENLLHGNTVSRDRARDLLFPKRDSF